MRVVGMDNTFFKGFKRENTKEYLELLTFGPDIIGVEGLDHRFSYAQKCKKCTAVGARGMDDEVELTG